MRLARTLLVLVAFTTLVLIGTVLRDGLQRTPNSVVARARSFVEGEEPDFSKAFATLEFGLEALAASHSREALSEIALERLRTYRARWDRSLTDKSIVHDPADLELVLRDAVVFLDAFDADNIEALTLGMRSALDVDRPRQALPLAERLRELARSDRERSDAAAVLGQTHVAIADKELLELVDSRNEWSHYERREQLERIRRVATRLASDPERMLLFREYRAELPPQPAEDAVEIIRHAAGYLTTAGTSFLDALALAPEEKAVVGLQDLLLRAGAYGDAIDIGRSSLRRTGLRESTPVFVRTVRAMWASGYVSTPRALIRNKFEDRRNSFNYKALELDQFAPWCEILLSLEDWAALERAALALRSRNRLLGVGPANANLGHFYAFLGRTHVGRFERLGGSVESAKPRRPESYPGQLMEYWWAVRTFAVSAGDAGAERRALLKTTQSAPLEISIPRLRAVAGEAWLALGRAYLAEEDWIPAEECLSHALRFLPGERGLLEPLWERAGGRAVVRRGRSLPEVLASPLRQEGVAGYPPMGPFEACLRIETALAQGRVRDLTHILGPALDHFPDLPRALEARARGSLRLRHFEPAIEALLSLVESGSGTPTTSHLLEEIPTEAFRGDQVRRLLLSAPEGAGFRILLARRIVAGGGAADSDPLPLLTGIDVDKTSDGIRMLGARAWLDFGRAARAQDWYLRTPQDSSELGAWAGLGLRCAAAVERAEAAANPASERREVREMVEHLLRAPAIDDRRLGEGLDALIADGHAQAARRFLEGIDARGDRVTPENLLRWGLSSTLVEDGGAPSDAFERARPYLGGGRIDCAQLFCALLGSADEPPDKDIRSLASKLLDTPLAGPRVARALVNGLAGRYPEAWRLLEGQDSDPRVPTARELIGIGLERMGGAASTDTPRLDPLDQPWLEQDPAPGLALLLGSGMPLFSAWAVAFVDRLPAEWITTPLADRIKALGWIALHRPRRADELLEPWTARYPELSEMRRLRGHVAELRWEEQGHQGPDAASADALVFFGEPGESVRKLIQEARAVVSRGNPDAARAILAAGLSEFPSSRGLELELARLLDREGTRSTALDHYDRVFSRAHPRAAALIPEVLELLRAGRLDGELTQPVVWSELDALEALFPRSPALPLELVRLRMAHGDAEPVWSTRRALDHLRRFRQRTRPRSVESSGPGSAVAWTAFYDGVDPVEAGRFALAELDARPQSLALWGLWCRSLEQLNRRREALAAYESLLSIVNDRALDRGYASLLFDSGLPLPAALAARIEENSVETPDLALRLALHHMREAGDDEERDARRGAALALWRERAENGLDGRSAARHLALALEAGDRATDTILAAAIAEESDEQARAILEALRNLSAR